MGGCSQTSSSTFGLGPVPGCVAVVRAVSNTAVSESAAFSLPVSEALCGDVLSLPMHAYMTDTDRDRIVATVLRAFDIQPYALGASGSESARAT